VDAIVPAYNEEQTVAEVVAPLVRSGVFRRVLLVDDGSEDNTVAAAAGAGAQVLSMPQNVGKGAAMLAAVESCPGDVAFFDADLVGLQPGHAQQLMYAYGKGYDMVCAMRDYGRIGGVLQCVAGPIITGERIVRRWILELLPQTCWDGYSIETGINFVCDQWGGRTCLVTLEGVSIRTKMDKEGWLTGGRKHLAMYAQVAATKSAMERSDGLACKI
jgi:glycosyltransferase involved in cell wall biosynthesis